MFKSNRLTALFHNTPRMSYDDDSKFVFFGDTHRGDNSTSDEFARNHNIYYYALAYYYSKDFIYIETGDGDELWEQPNYRIIIDAHIDVFTILKQFHDDNRLIMLYGNHNIQMRNPDFVSKYLTDHYDEFIDAKKKLFTNLKPVESIVLKHRKTGNELFVVHGHQGDTLNDEFWPISFFLVRYFWRFMHILGVNYAASPAKNKYKRHKIERAYSKWALKEGVPILCGHTHRAKFPRKNDAAYFNTGCCIHPRGITCIELEDGKIKLVDWTVQPDSSGALYINRSVRRGPESMRYFERGYRKPIRLED